MQTQPRNTMAKYCSVTSFPPDITWHVANSIVKRKFDTISHTRRDDNRAILAAGLMACLATLADDETAEAADRTLMILLAPA